MNKLERMNELTEILNRYGIAYYTYDKPEVSDREYDKLYDELKTLEAETGVILPDSPTNRIGGEVLEKFEKVSHRNPLWSMDKSRTLEELRAWDTRNKREIENYERATGEKLPQLDYMLEYKFDGLTVNLTYENGIFIQGATRGNGLIGEKITSQIKKIPTVPLKVEFKNLTEIQGEGVMPLSVLEKYNATHEEKLKNARNAAAGALRNLDPEITRERGLRVYVYNIGFIENKNFETHLETLEFLKANGFPVFPYYKKFEDFEELLREIELQGEERHNLDVLTDGMCIKVNSLRLREVLGYTNKFPRWAMAYKYEAEEVLTELKEVIWNVGRTGKVTPSAVLEPVEISGATVSRATLNNYDDILRKGLRLNSDVIVRRSNEVIPEILRAEDTERETFEIEKPTRCPFCNSELIQDGVHLFCPNSLTCKPQLVMRMVHFASRNAMNIEGLSEKTAELLMDNNLVSHISDLYRLKSEDLLKLPLFKEKKTENLLGAIEGSKNPHLSAFIYAIGIRNIGIATAVVLAKKFGSWENFSLATKEELTTIPDIGEVVADNILEFFNDKTIQEGISELFSLGVTIKAEKSENSEFSGFFSGKTVVITGTFKNMKRDEMEEVIRKFGGKATSSVSKNTDYVVYGENSGSKKDKAIQLGIELIDENKWNSIIEEEFYGKE